jgi:hypothetical protein
MLSCISSGCRGVARSLQKDIFDQLLSEELIFRCHAEKRSMCLRELRAREICVTAGLNVYFSERPGTALSGDTSSGGTVPTEAFLIDDLKSCFVEGSRDGYSLVVLVYRRRFGLGCRPVVFQISALELARFNPVLSSMAQRRNIGVQLAPARDSFKSRRSMSRSTEASDDERSNPRDELDNSDDNDSCGLAPRSTKKVTVLIGKVALGVPARLELEKACDVCNFLVGFGVSTAEFEEFATRLACKNRLVEIKDGKVGARGLGVLSRSLPDLLEFRRQQEALAEAEEALRTIVRRRAKTVVSDALTSAVLDLTRSSP